MNIMSLDARLIDRQILHNVYGSISGILCPAFIPGKFIALQAGLNQLGDISKNNFQKNSKNEEEKILITNYMTKQSISGKPLKKQAQICADGCEDGHP